MSDPKQMYYEKRGNRLVENFRKRHFDAVYCATKEQALQAALAWIPANAVVGWGGAMSAQQIGLMTAVKNGEYQAIDRDLCKTMEEREEEARIELMNKYSLKEPATFPQIVINGHNIGGYSELVEKYENKLIDFN